MKKKPGEHLKSPPFDTQPGNASAKFHVRYVGFQSIEGGRRIHFSVKAAGRELEEITIEVSDAAFVSTPGISFQDAAPMAYTKIVELLAKGDTIDSNKLCLTNADIAEYISRHLSSQKRRFLERDTHRRSDIAA